MPEEQGSHEIAAMAVMAILIAFLAVLFFASTRADAQTRELTVAQLEELTLLEAQAYQTESEMTEAERTCHIKRQAYEKAKQLYEDALALPMSNEEIDLALVVYTQARDHLNSAIQKRDAAAIKYSEAQEKLCKYMIKVGLLAAPTSDEQI